MQTWIHRSLLNLEQENVRVAREAQRIIRPKREYTPSPEPRACRIGFRDPFPPIPLTVRYSRQISRLPLRAGGISRGSPDINYRDLEVSTTSAPRCATSSISSPSWHFNYHGRNDGFPRD